MCPVGFYFIRICEWKTHRAGRAGSLMCGWEDKHRGHITSSESAEAAEGRPRMHGRSSPSREERLSHQSWWGWGEGSRIPAVNGRPENSVPKAALPPLDSWAGFFFFFFGLREAFTVALIVLCLFTINLSYVRSRRESVLWHPQRWLEVSRGGGVGDMPYRRWCQQGLMELWWTEGVPGWSTGMAERLVWGRRRWQERPPSGWSSRLAQMNSCRGHWKAPEEANCGKRWEEPSAGSWIERTENGSGWKLEWPGDWEGSEKRAFEAGMLVSRPSWWPCSVHGCVGPLSPGYGRTWRANPIHSPEKGLGSRDLVLLTAVRLCQEHPRGS